MGSMIEICHLPIAWSDDTFIPFDWGYLAFVYDSNKLAKPARRA